MMENFQVGDWIACPNELCLRNCRHKGSEKRLEPKTMAVLQFLAAKAPNVITKDELLEHVWHGVVVGENVIYRAIAILRRALNDRDTDTHLIESIPRKGYRLNSAVAFQPKALADDQSLTVIENPGQGQISIGLKSLDLPNKLLNAINRNIKTYLTWASDAFRVYFDDTDNALDYLIQTSVLESQNDLTVLAEIVDAKRNTLVKSKFFQFQNIVRHPQFDSTCELMANGIEKEIRRYHCQRVIGEGLSLTQMNYWQLIFTSDRYDGIEREKLMQRQQKLCQAIQLYPSLAPAHAAYADFLSWRVINGISKTRELDLQNAEKAARTAIDLDHDSAYVLSRCGEVYIRIGKIALGKRLCENAFAISPSLATKDSLAKACTMDGDPETAIELLVDIMHRQPSGYGFQYGKLVVPLTQMGRFDEARYYAKLSVDHYPRDYFGWVLYCNILFSQHQDEQGMSAWQEVLLLMPTISIDKVIENITSTYGKTKMLATHLTYGLDRLRAKMAMTR